MEGETNVAQIVIIFSTRQLYVYSYQNIILRLLFFHKLHFAYRFYLRKCVSRTLGLKNTLAKIRFARAIQF